MIATILFVLAQAQPKPERIPLPDGIRHGATFSPDGEWVYFFEDTPRTEKTGKQARNVALFRTSLDGKKVEKLLDVGNTVGEVHWHSDGRRMALVRRVDDTNGDGKIDHKDGDSLWIGELDAKNPQVFVAPSPKKLSFYGFLAEGKCVLGYRDSSEADARIVVRDSAGKEDEICKAQCYLLLDGAVDWIAVTAPDDGHGHGRELKWQPFSFEKKKTLEASFTHVQGRLVPVAGRMHHVRRGEGPQPTGTLVACSLDGSGAADVARIEGKTAAMGSWQGRLVLLRGGNELVWCTEYGTLESMWVAPGAIHGFHRNPARAVITVVRDTTGDGKSRPWEDASDLYLLSLPSPTADELKQTAAYLQRAAARLAAGPHEIILGAFVGRRCTGTQRLTSKPATDGTIEFSSGGRRVTLNKDLQPLASEKEEGGVKIREEWKDGFVLRRTETAGKTVDRRMEHLPGSRDADLNLFLALVESPKPGEKPVLLSQNGEILDLLRPSATEVHLRMRAMQVELRILLDGAGKLVRIDSWNQPGQILPNRSLPNADKDLEAPKLRDSEKAAIAFLAAVHAKDTAAALALVDFDRMAREADPKFPTLPQDQKDARLKELRGKMEGFSFAADLPAGMTIEDLLGPYFETSEKDGVADIRAGKLALRLAAREGKWVVVCAKTD